jgi:predicted lipase
VKAFIVSLQVFVTGHSLGGALANLAAFDIKKALEWSKKETRVICYTFGAPRTGNHAFADDYNQVVPDTWSIINDQVSGLAGYLPPCMVS